MKQKRKENRSRAIDSVLSKTNNFGLILQKNNSTTPKNGQSYLFPDGIKKIFTGSDDDRGKSRCYHCMIFVDSIGAVAFRQLGSMLYQIALCRNCFIQLSNLPYFLQKSFWQKVEKNLELTLEVKFDG